MYFCRPRPINSAPPPRAKHRLAAHALKARTAEFTPPAMCRRASRNSLREARFIGVARGFQALFYTQHDFSGGVTGLQQAVGFGSLRQGQFPADMNFEPAPIDQGLRLLSRIICRWAIAPRAVPDIAASASARSNGLVAQTRGFHRVRVACRLQQRDHVAVDLGGGERAAEGVAADSTEGRDSRSPARGPVKHRRHEVFRLVVDYALGAELILRTRPCRRR